MTEGKVSDDNILIEDDNHLKPTSKMSVLYSLLWPNFQSLVTMETMQNFVWSIVQSFKTHYNFKSKKSTGRTKMACTEYFGWST